MSLVEINFATEGLVDAAVAERLIRHCGASPGHKGVSGGKSRLDPNIARYALSANHLPWLILRDLDHDAECAPALRNSLSSNDPELLCLRIVVREIEAWLMLDRESMCSFLRVRPSRIPNDPEGLDDPKQSLVNAARTSTSQGIRMALVPKPGAGASEGPEFAAQMVDFVWNHWDVQRALADNPTSSLARAVRCLQRLIEAAQLRARS